MFGSFLRARRISMTMAFALTAALIGSTLSVFALPQSASAVPFVSTLTMPTAPGVKSGVLPGNGYGQIRVDQSTGGQWTISGDGGDVRTPGGNYVTYDANPANRLPSGYANITVDSGDHAGYITGPSVPKVGYAIASAYGMTYYPVPADPVGLANVSTTASASSGLTPTLTSLTPSVCSISGLSIATPTYGYCTIAASQSGDSNYYAAGSVVSTFVMSGAGATKSQTVTFPQPANAGPVGTTVTYSPTASSGLPVTLTTLTPDTCSASGLNVTLVARGTCTISARQNGNASWLPAQQTRSFSVYSGVTGTTSQNLSFFSGAYNKWITTDTSWTVPTPTVTSGLAVTLTNQTPAVCTLSGYTVTPLKTGSCRITAYQAGNSTYAEAEASETYNISGPGGTPAGPATQTITLGALNARTLPSLSGWDAAAADSVTHNLYILNPSRKSVWEFVRSTETWTEISLSSVASSTLTQIDVDTAHGLVLVTDRGNGKVHVIDESTRSYVSSLTVGTSPWGINVDNVHNVGYVANSGGKSVSVLDLSTATPSVSSTLSFTTYDPKVVSIDTVNLWLYVGSMTTGVAVVDLQNNNAVYEINGTGSGIRTIAANPVSKTATYGTDTVQANAYYYVNTIGYIPDITSAAPVNGTYNVAYAGHQMTAIGSPTSTYSKTSGTLPPGLTLSSAGALTGTPTSPGLYTFTITADNGFGTDAETYTIHIPVPPPVLTAATFADAYVGEAYIAGTTWQGPQYHTIPSTWLSAAYAVSGTDPFRVTVGNLPPGISLNPNNGQFSGTPTTAGTYTFTVTGTNSNLAASNPVTQTTTRQYTITVQPPRPPMIDSAMTWWNNQAPYEGGGNNGTTWMSMTLASGSPAATWSISAGALPSGMSLDTSWPGYEALTGGPITDPAGTAYSFTIRATAANGLYDEKTFTGSVTGAPPSFSGTNVTTFEGTPVYFNPRVSIGNYNGGTGSAPLTWSINQGSQHQLPSGLALNSSTGVISGTPAVGASNAGSSGTYYVNVDVTNASGSSSPGYTITVNPALPSSQKQTINMAEGATLPSGTFPVVPVAGVQPDPSPWWNPVVGSNKPAWLSIDDANSNGTGELSGTAPSGSAGTYVLVLAYWDAGSTAQYFLEVSLVVTPAAPAMAATTAISKNAGSAFAQPITNTGGAADACAVANSTSLPTGVTLSVANGNCVVHGTASVAAGTYSFDVEASNLNGTQASVTSVTLTINSLPVVPSTLALYWATGTNNSFTLTPSAGATPIAFALTSNGGASWLNAAANGGGTAGIITGNPSSAGSYTATVQASNTPGSSSTTLSLTTLVAPTLAAISVPAPTVGVTYTSQNPLYTIPAPTAGTGPFTYSATGLPTGLSINSATGAITGTATSTTAGSVVITVANASAYTAYQANPANVAASLVVSTSAQTVTPVVLAPQYATTVTQYVVASSSNGLNYSPAGTGGSPATTWSVAGGSTLPSWISLNSSTGALTNASAAPSTATTETFSVVASNGTSPDATIAYTIQVAVAPNAPVLSPAPTAPVIGQPYTYTVPAPTTGTAPFTYTLTGTLPAGLNFNTSTGVISGTPTGTGSTGTFTVTVNNALTTALGTGAATSASTSLQSSVVTPVVVISSPVASANLAPVSIQPTTTSTTSPATSWSATGLPAGVTINTTTGAITGSPTAPGSYTVSVTATNSGGTSTAQTLVINATAVPLIPGSTATTTGSNGIPTTVSLTTPTLAFGVSGQTYTIPSTGSYPTPVTFTSSNLPSWASLSSSGVITGTPPVGTTNPTTFTVTASNGVGSGTSIAVSIPLVTTAPTIAATTPFGNVSPVASTTNTLVQSGGSPASAYALGTTSLGAGNTAPSWVSINPSTGAITMSPQNANPALTGLPQNFSFPVTLTNSGGSVTTTVTLTVADVPIIPATLSYTIPTGTAWSHNFLSDITSTNGPFTWALTGSPSNAAWLGSTGLFASSSVTGAVAGTPSADGTTTFNFSVSNANGTVPVSVTIVAATAPSWTAGAVSPGPATTGVPYSYTLPTPSGTGPFSYAVSPLPSWATLTGNVITGTPPTSGTVNFTATATNVLGNGSAASQSSSIVITTVAPTMPATQNVSVTTLTAPNTQFAATGGSPVVSWSATGLPTGLSINTSTGQLVGTPTTPGTYNVTVTASNAANGGGTGSTAVTLTVTSPPVVAATATAPTASTGSPYTYTVPVTAGGAPYTYSVPAGTLPSWATLNSNGTITGTPTSAGGPTTVTVTVSNGTGTSTHTVTLSSAVPTTVAATTTLNATVNQAFTQTVTPSGTGPFTWSYSGSLPAGVQFNTTTGVISGTPTGAATGSFTVSVTGAVGGAQSSTVNYTIVLAAPTYPTTVMQYATATQPFTYTFAQTGGSNPSSHALSGTFPSAMTFSTSSGTHSGTPAVGDVGSHTGTYTGTNSGGSGSTSYTLTVLGVPVLPSATTGGTATSGTGYTLPITATGTGLGTLTYSVTAGSLPPGLTLNPSTGAITGTPTQTSGGTVTFTVTATNQAGYQVGTVVSIPVTVPVVSSGTSGSTGTVSRSSSIGTGLTAGSGTASATVTGSTSATAAKSVTVPTVTGTLGQSVSTTVPGIAGKTVQSFSVTKGSLPQGVTLNPQTGAITGTPTKAGTTTFTVTVLATDGTVEERVLTISYSEPAALATTAIDDSMSWMTVAAWVAGGLFLLLFLWVFLAWRRRRRDAN